MDHHIPQREGLLYSPRYEHDACGVGFVADIHGRRSHEILWKAIQAVVNLTHRGAVSADGKSGDGAGILTQIPYRFFRGEIERLGLRVPPEGDLAVGMIFLPGGDGAARDRCVEIIETA